MSHNSVFGDPATRRLAFALHVVRMHEPAAAPDGPIRSECKDCSADGHGCTTYALAWNALRADAGFELPRPVQKTEQTR